MRRKRITYDIFGEETGIHNFKRNNYTGSNMQKTEAYGTMRTKWFNKVLEDIIQTGQTLQGIEKERLWEDKRLEDYCFKHIDRNNSKE